MINHNTKKEALVGSTMFTMFLLLSLLLGMDVREDITLWVMNDQLTDQAWSKVVIWSLMLTACAPIVVVAGHPKYALSISVAIFALTFGSAFAIGPELVSFVYELVNPVRDVVSIEGSLALVGLSILLNATLFVKAARSSSDYLDMGYSDH